LTSSTVEEKFKAKYPAYEIMVKSGETSLKLDFTE